MQDIGIFKDGKWVSENTAILAEYKLKYANRKTILTVEPWHPTRSLKENSYMWGVVYEYISQFTGMTPNEAHRACKAEFNYTVKEVLNKDTGELKEIRIPQSTKKLSTKSMEIYLENIRRYYLIEFGLMIPLPNEVL